MDDETDDLDPLVERVGNARCMLLGEASHGSLEHYAWRAPPTRRLVRSPARRPGG